MTEPSPIERFPTMACASIVPTLDRAIQPAWMLRMARKGLRVEPIEIVAGHLPHTTRPERFAEILEEILRT